MFTKGPWNAELQARRHGKGFAATELTIYAQDAPPGSKIVASTWGSDTVENARLIAQAPTAHQLLKEALWVIEDDDAIEAGQPLPEPRHMIDLRDWIKSARAYLAAVEGK